MAINSAPINLLAFPQRWDPPRLTLNVLILPKGDPLAFAPAFPDCTLALEAALIAGAESLPSAGAVTTRRPLDLQIAANRPGLFTALAAAIPVRAHAGAVPPHAPGTVKNASVSSYFYATVGARPASTVLVRDDCDPFARRESG